MGVGKAFFYGMVFALFILMLGGCATSPKGYPAGYPAAYFDLGVGYAFDASDFLWVNADGSLTHIEDTSCEVGYFALGVEFENKVTLEWIHRSCLWDSPELVYNDIVIKKRFGGK